MDAVAPLDSSYPLHAWHEVGREFSMSAAGGEFQNGSRAVTDTLMRLLSELVEEDGALLVRQGTHRAAVGRLMRATGANTIMRSVTTSSSS